MQKIDAMASNFVLAAVPLFIFMGAMLERAGIAERLFEAIHLWTRRLPGGLAIGTVLMCVVFAASSGVIGATETVVGLLTIPVMLKYNYDKALISGVICAGGSLGTIIPPSIVVVLLGPVANVSIGDLMFGMLFPGLLMAFLYIVYILGLCTIWPESGPAHSALARRSVVPGEVPHLARRAVAADAADRRGARLDHVRHRCADGSGGPWRARCAAAVGLLRRLLARGAARALREDAQGHGHDPDHPDGGQHVRRGLHRRRRRADDRKFDSGPEPRAVADAWLFLFICFLAGFILDWISILLIFIPVFMPILTKLGFDPVWFCVLFPRHPDELSVAADGAGDLLPARHRAAGDHHQPHVPRRGSVHHPPAPEPADRRGVPKDVLWLPSAFLGFQVRLHRRRALV